MIALLPIDWQSTPLRRTYAADKALVAVRHLIDLKPHEQERFRQLVSARKDRRYV